MYQHAYIVVLYHTYIMMYIMSVCVCLCICACMLELSTAVHVMCKRQKPLLAALKELCMFRS